MVRVTLLVRSLATGGAERQAAVTATALRRKGFAVSVAVLYPGGRTATALQDSGVTVIDLARRSRWDVVGPLVRLRRHLREYRSELLYSYTPGPNILAATVKCAIPNLALVWGIRAADMRLHEYGPASVATFRVARCLSGLADRIIVNSEAGRVHHERFGYPSRRMTVIPNGIDTAVFAPDALRARDIRRQLGIPLEVPVIGIVARLDAAKDYETLLRAAAILKKRVSDARLLCVGAGRQEYAAALRRMAHALGVADMVVWAGHREDIAAVFGAMTLATSSSSTEGFSNAIAEAMACGVPVVATRVGDTPRIVGDTGIVVPSRDPAALAEGWFRMLSADLREERRRARLRIEELFSVDRMCESTASVILECVRDRAASSPATEPTIYGPW